ncbi:ABC transporter permease [Virgibacillus sp. NKC19-3]|uniref:ABC transporter permease n=1 Tax=Virgibacillus saliphilus TaxID=2831674 RepID=UPI001C9B78C6|nr:ABC transporter permease [Virgibacillus sp. NKC19-3]MBY7144037.1 ABC transporter permease [Virgibacillus sp. NKC19-3]
MTGRQLFRRRFVEEWKFQWKVLRSVFDWSIILYAVVPAFIVAPLVYMEMWQDIHIYWSEEIPLSILIGIILMLSIIGNFRTFLLEADMLFLMQRKQVLYQLKLSGFLYSICQIILSTAVIFIVILPILLFMYDFVVMDILFLFIVVNACRFSMLTLKKVITRVITRWMIFPVVFMVTYMLILHVNGVLLAAASVVVIGGVCYFHVTRFVRTNRYFLQELVIEQTERVRYIKFILMFSQEVEQAPVKQRKLPMLFPNSKHMFQKRNKENGLLEFLLKAFLRHKGYMVSLSQIVGLTIFGVIVLPVWLKWMLCICFVFFLNTWTKSIYLKLIESPFFVVVPYGGEEVTYAVWPRFRRWIVGPSIVFVAGVSLVLSVKAFF